MSGMFWGAIRLTERFKPKFRDSQN
jgi:hypothetical protein